jgi:hypothetical protein
MATIRNLHQLEAFNRKQSKPKPKKMKKEEFDKKENKSKYSFK